MSFYTMVIVNPTSGNGRTGRRWPELRAALDAVLERWDNEFTIAPGDATRIARDAVEKGYEMIVSVGGDGTMNEVVDGLFAPDAPEGRLLKPNMVIAPVRVGTGGDFARYLDLPTTLPSAVEHLRGDATRPCDLGWCEYRAHSGETARRGFLNIASFGLSGVVDEKVNKTSKALGGKASFFLGLGRALVGYRPQGVEIKVDGEPFYSDTLVTCAAANGQYFGGGMHFAPRAEIDDGLLDVVVQTRSGVKEVLSVGDLYNGRMMDWQTVVHTRGKVVEAAPISDGRVLLDIDGEQPGMLPATFRVVEHAVRLKVQESKASNSAD